jgi:hypothetical protein
MIFEAFTQEDSTVSRRYGGSGLGLTISNRLAQLLGGTLQLSSQPGKGSIFSLFIPFERTDYSSPEQPLKRWIHRRLRPILQNNTPCSFLLWMTMTSIFVW